MAVQANIYGHDCTSAAYTDWGQLKGRSGANRRMSLPYHTCNENVVEDAVLVRVVRRSVACKQSTEQQHGTSSLSSSPYLSRGKEKLEKLMK
eukprot:3687127-Pleurochrysis_carterae.AAC.2